MSRSDLVVRTLFLSDVHLGTKGCQPELLLDFLKHCEADTIYLVGDIVDGWRLKSGWYWPQLHNDVVQKLLRKVRKGVAHRLRARQPRRVPARLRRKHVRWHRDCRRGSARTADGRQVLVFHGDKFDVVVTHVRWLAHLGDSAYEAAIWLEQPDQPDPPAPRPALLVFLGLGKAEG